MFNTPSKSELVELLKYLTPQEIEELDSLLQFQQPTTKNPLTLTDFKRKLYRRYEHALHLELLDSYLSQVALYVESRGQEGLWLLIIELPPRHGKTLTVSRFFPAWFLGRNPDHRVILTSYGATLAEKNSRYVRNLMMSPNYHREYPIALAQDSRAVDAFNIAGYEGGADAMGILGGATGKGAHLLLMDDLIKNREEAESETIREKLWDALNDDLLTRLEPFGAVVLCATRWHQDDPSGRALKYYKSTPLKPIVRLRLPALAEMDDVLKREVGQALWPNRYPQVELLATRERMGEYSFSALYQQNPVPAEGGIFKQAWFSPALDVCPPITRAVRYWDLAMSEKTSADYTVGVKLGQGEDGHYYILDVVRRQIDWGNLTEWMASVILEDGRNVAQGIEEKGYMSRAIQNLNADPRLHNYEIWGYPVDKDKVTRALPYAAKCGASLVHVLNRHWTQEYVDELCSFPSGTYDDQVDGSSGAWAMIDEGMVIGTGHVSYADEYTITAAY